MPIKRLYQKSESFGQLSILERALRHLAAPWFYSLPAEEPHLEPGGLTEVAIC